jgi:hypothetical protein
VLYIKIEVSHFWMHYCFYVTWNQIVSSFFGGHPLFNVDLHFATCGAIDILRLLSILKCVQTNEIVPYNEDLNSYSCMNHIMWKCIFPLKVHISTESAYLHRWQLGLKLLKINSLYSLGLKLMNWTSIKYLRMHIKLS